LNVDEAQSEQISYNDMHKKLMDTLKRSFRPEFINRLDSIIVFRSLNRDDIREIVAIEIAKVSERLSEYKLALEPTQSALNFLAKAGYDPEMGARPVRRVIQQQVEEGLSDAILAGKFVPGDTVVVDVVKPDKDAEAAISLYKKEAKPTLKKKPRTAKVAITEETKPEAKPKVRKPRTPKEPINV
jgi:ATP-dependent Clp protease ATP-binding subunit ClpA